MPVPEVVAAEAVSVEQARSRKMGGRMTQEEWDEIRREREQTWPPQPPQPLCLTCRRRTGGRRYLLSVARTQKEIEQTEKARVRVRWTECTK